MTTGALLLIGASSADPSWDAIDWQTAERSVRRLQMRIAKATRARRWGKVQALQRLLTHSFAAKLLAVRRVVQTAVVVRPGLTVSSGQRHVRNLMLHGHCEDEGTGHSRYVVCIFLRGTVNNARWGYRHSSIERCKRSTCSH